MPTDQSTDDTAAAGSDFIEPRPATAHLSVTTDTARVVPERRSIWPLAPWRWVLLITGGGLAVFCAIPAIADPVVNGADLGFLISLAILVAAFTPGKD